MNGNSAGLQAVPTAPSPSRRPIHVCILTTAHPVDDVRLKHKVVDTLIEEGFAVTWVGPAHRYVTEPERQSSSEGCEYRLFTPAKNRLGRLLSRELRQTARSVTDVDVYYAPEPDSARAALSLARQNGAKVIFDIHELYDQAHVRNWAPAPLLPLASRMVRAAIARISAGCDLVLAVSEGVLAPYRHRARASLIVRNCAPLWFGADTARASGRTNDGSFRVMHGKSTAYNGTAPVLRALALAHQRIPLLRAVVFEWLQNSQEDSLAQLKADIASHGLEQVVELLAPVPMEQVPAILESCDVGMISHGRMLAAGTQPNRLYEYMAVGLPVIAPVYDRGIAPVVESEKLGVLVDSEDPSAIADAIVYLYDHRAVREEMGRRAREAFTARHNWTSEFERVTTTLRSWFPDRRRA